MIFHSWDLKTLFSLIDFLLLPVRQHFVSVRGSHMVTSHTVNADNHIWVMVSPIFVLKVSNDITKAINGLVTRKATG